MTDDTPFATPAEAEANTREIQRRAREAWEKQRAKLDAALNGRKRPDVPHEDYGVPMLDEQ